MGRWFLEIRDEMRASAFHVIWMMHYFHPTDRSIDFLYQSTFSTHPFLTDASVKWPDPVGIAIELLLLYADNGITDALGNTIDWNNQKNIDELHLPLTWQDSARGYVDVRNSWRKDDLHVGFVCKQDFFMADMKVLKTTESRFGKMASIGYRTTICWPPKLHFYKTC